MDSWAVLQKCTHFCKIAQLQQFGFFVNLRSIPECCKRHSAFFCSSSSCYLFVFPPLIAGMEVIRQRLRRSAETDSLCFRGSNSLRLPLMNGCPLIFSDKGQHLQHDITEKCSNKIFPAPRIQKRHINDTDVRSFFLCQNPPLILDFLIISSETVYAFYVKQIVRFYFPDKFFVLRSVKILAGLLIHKDVLFIDANLLQSDQLPILVLVFA